MYQTYEQRLVIFTDGSSLQNPGPGGFGAVLVFQLLDEVVELGGSKPRTTNNEMELSAVIAALSHSSTSAAPVDIYTDSSYVISGITKWLPSWERRDWMTSQGEPVAHRALWETLRDLVQERERVTTISWHHVSGHSGLIGNERADTIATSFAGGNQVTLFRGKLSTYPHQDILNITYDETKKQDRTDARKHAREKAYSYVSRVDGVTMVHQTWQECKDRVAGKNAKYRKAISADDQERIISEWSSS